MPIVKTEESMFNKRLGSMVILLVILAFPVSAAMVSIVLVETGVNDRISTGQYSSVWEGGLMSAFFDAGHIVTNSPIARIERKPNPYLSGQIRAEFNEAINGGADYIILGLIEYNTREGMGTPVGIVLKLYDSISEQLIYEQNFPAGPGRSNNEEYQFAQNAARLIISHLKDR